MNPIWSIFNTKPKPKTPTAKARRRRTRDNNAASNALERFDKAITELDEVLREKSNSDLRKVKKR